MVTPTIDRDVLTVDGQVSLITPPECDMIVAVIVPVDDRGALDGVVERDHIHNDLPAVLAAPTTGETRWAVCLSGCVRGRTLVSVAELVAGHDGGRAVRPGEHKG